MPSIRKIDRNNLPRLVFFEHFWIEFTIGLWNKYIDADNSLKGSYIIGFASSRKQKEVYLMGIIYSFTVGFHHKKDPSETRWNSWCESWSIGCKEWTRFNWSVLSSLRALWCILGSQIGFSTFSEVKNSWMILNLSEEELLSLISGSRIKIHSHRAYS